MTRRLATLALSIAFAALVTQTPGSILAFDEKATFNKDVLPILQRNCQVCHRPGEAAPMSFLTYESTRPWAKAIKQAVTTRQMPPWFADPIYGTFRNAPKMTAADIKVLVAWVDGGAIEGDAKDKSAPVQWPEGWRIKPDVVASMAEPHVVQAKGGGEIKSFILASPFKEDTWVSSIEVRPGDPSVVHHVIVQLADQNAQGHILGGGPCASCPASLPLGLQRIVGSQRVQSRPGGAGEGGGYSGSGGGEAGFTQSSPFQAMEAVYVPGAPPMDYRFHNSAKFIPGGANIRLEVHYTPNGRKTSDQTRVGFTVLKEPAKRRFIAMAPTSMVESSSFRIPAGASNFETRGELTFIEDADLVWFMPHMHLRGKDMTYRLLYPNGRSEVVLSAKFNFNWQLGYEVAEPIRVPKGTKLIVTAHHDNSANNPFNPDPSRPVQWGELTSEEMVIPWFGVVVDRDIDPTKIAVYKPAGRPQGLLETPAWQRQTPTSTVPGVTPTTPRPDIRLPIPSIKRN